LIDTIRDQDIDISDTPEITPEMFAHDQHKILLIHPSPKSLIDSARGAISKNWDNWLNQKRLSIICKKIEDTSWSEISAQVESEG
jgi:hypothetical protein